MISDLSRPDVPQRDSLLIIGDDPVLDSANGENLDGRYANWRIARRFTYLSGIAELARHRARAVLVFVDASTRRLNDAVAGGHNTANVDGRQVAAELLDLLLDYRCDFFWSYRHSFLRLFT